MLSARLDLNISIDVEYIKECFERVEPYIPKDLYYEGPVFRRFLKILGI